MYLSRHGCVCGDCASPRYPTLVQEHTSDARAVRLSRHEPASESDGPQIGDQITVTFVAGDFVGTVLEVRWPCYMVKYENGRLFFDRLTLP